SDLLNQEQTWDQILQPTEWSVKCVYGLVYGLVVSSISRRPPALAADEGELPRSYLRNVLLGEPGDAFQCGLQLAVKFSHLRVHLRVAAIGKALARDNSTGPGLATSFGPCGPSIVNATEAPCSNWVFRPSRAVAPPRLLDPRTATKPSFSAVRAMYSPSKLRLTITAIPAFLHNHAPANTARCQKE